MKLLKSLRSNRLAPSRSNDNETETDVARNSTPGSNIQGHSSANEGDPEVQRHLENSSESLVTQQDGDARIARIRRVFAPQFYLQIHPDVEQAQVDPWEHYVAHGFLEGRAISPEGLDIEWYRGVYLDPTTTNDDVIRHYLSVGMEDALMKGNGLGELVQLRPFFEPRRYLAQYRDVATANYDPWHHFVAFGYAEGRTGAPTFDPVIGDTTVLRQTTREALHAVRSLDVWLERISDTDLSGLPMKVPASAARKSDFIRDVLEAINRDYRYLVVGRSFEIGGAERYGSYIFNCLNDREPASTLYIVTDESSDQKPRWLTTTEHVLSFEALARAPLDPEQRRQAITKVISLLKPSATINVNSRALWDAMELNSDSLSRFTRLFVSLFCYDYSGRRLKGGYAATHFRPVAAYLQGVLLDNKNFRQQLISDLALPPTLQNKLHIAYSPVSRVEERPERCYNDGPKRVLWCSRICHQKQPLMMLQIASTMPTVQFEVVGSGDAELESRLRAAPLANVTWRPGYRSGQPNFADYDAFLYTSLWDGIPTILLDVAEAGLPIIASAVGGIPELISERTGWPVSDNSAAEYVSALATALGDPQEAMKRARALQRHVITRHSISAFADALQGAGLYQ